MDDPRAVAAFEAIHAGDVERLGRLLAEHPALATARFADEHGHERTLLHVATDWPGHFPRGAETVAALVTRCPPAETPYPAIRSGSRLSTPAFSRAQRNAAQTSARASMGVTSPAESRY